MKILHLIYLATSFLLLTACHSQPSPEPLPVGEIFSEQSINDSESALNNYEAFTPKETSLYNVKVSTEEVTVVYTGNIKLSPDFCTANDEYLYFFELADDGIETLCRMKLGSSDIERIAFTLPLRMEVTSLLSDVYNRIHVSTKERLAMVETGADREFAVYVLDNNGNELSFVDISKHIINDETPPFIRSIDREGNYYITAAEKDADLLIVNAKGSLLSQIQYEKCGYEQLESMGRGRDGRVYAILSKDKESIVVVFDENEGAIYEEYYDILPDGEIWHRFLGAGTDTELLVYSRELGVYACDPKEGVWEYRIASEPREEEQKATRIREFLSDGRFLRAEMIRNDNLAVTEVRFFYLPAGRIS